nr:C4-type zinc ribbon domain-containing protein [Janibacter cremeus]
MLELQALDTRLQQIAHARTRVPQVAALEQAVAELQRAQDDVVRSETGLSDIRREVARAEADVQQVRDRAARDQQRLETGAGMTSRDLTALQSEIESLARRQGDLEEVEIEAMERQEAAEERVASGSEKQAEMQAEVERLTRERDEALAELDAEKEQVAAPRAELVASIDDALITLYDRIREKSGGLAAAELKHGRCGGCQLELNPVDLASIEKAPVDEVVRCEECDRILVRIPAPQS